MSAFDTLDTSIDEFVAIRTINGALMTLYGGDGVDVTVSYLISGEYTPAKLSGPPENCYPEEWPDMEIGGIELVDALPLHDENDNLVMILPAGTDVYSDLTKSQLDTVEQTVWDEALTGAY